MQITRSSSEHCMSAEFKMFILRKAMLSLLLTTVLFATSDKRVQVEAFDDECNWDSACNERYISKIYCCERKYPEGNVCKSNCLAETCIINSDCAPGECCDSNDLCSKSDCYSITGLAGWIIAVIVTGVLLVIVVPVAIIVFCCFCAGAAASSRRGQPQGGVIFSQQPTNTTFVTSQQLQPPSGQVYFQNPPPYPNQPLRPPAY